MQLPHSERDARRPVGQAVSSLRVRLLLASLAGVFIAELFVMQVLKQLSLEWGWQAALLDAALLSVLILPGIYFLVLRPVAGLAARLAVSAANERFRAVVEVTGDAIVIGDREGCIRYANPAALGMLGYSQGQLEGASVELLMGREHLERHFEELRRYLETGEAERSGREPVEAEALAIDGRRIPVELTISVPTAQEELIVVVLRDLRHRRQLRLYEAILPVCCVCGQIRDDTERGHGQGDWGSLEDYVSRRAAARFSHTFCPGCMDHYREEQGLLARV